jgi:hypothetical protein
VNEVMRGTVSKARLGWRNKMEKQGTRATMEIINGTLRLREKENSTENRRWMQCGGETWGEKGGDYPDVSGRVVRYHRGG